MTDVLITREVPVLANDEILETARRLAAGFAQGAADRDRERRLPSLELDELSGSGLLAITTPARFGGADASVRTLTEVIRILAIADGSIAQIPHSHFVFLDALRRQGSDEQQARYFAEVLGGARFANAQTERTSRTVTDDSTTLVQLQPESEGYLLSGEKFYCTGALLADWLIVRAVVAGAAPLPDGARPKVLAYIPRRSPGVTITDDWDGMGQRTTVSGTITLDDVRVATDQIVRYSPIFQGPTTYGARAQVLHAAIDAGIARGAVDAAVEAVAKARPWFEAGVGRAAEDPLLVQQAGDLEIEVRSAEALLHEAAAAVDAADLDPTEETTASASIAVAVAKVAAARAAVAAGSVLFELGGTRSASGAANLSRFWRDGRTHTLHDPSRWKVQHIGRWLLDGIKPPRHGQI